jgi:hypothetical protein
MTSLAATQSHAEPPLFDCLAGGVPTTSSGAGPTPLRAASHWSAKPVAGCGKRPLDMAGIRLAIEAEGRPVTDEAWGAMEKRFAGRLTAGQFKALKAWWKKSVEAGS